MASTSIQGRVDDKVWDSIRQEGETVTETLRRITTFYQTAQADRLTELAPTPDAAIAVLWHSHKMLLQFFSGLSVAIPQNISVLPEQETASSQATSRKAESEPSDDCDPLTQADDW